MANSSYTAAVSLLSKFQTKRERFIICRSMGSTAEEKPRIPLLTPYKMGNFQLSHRYNFFDFFFFYSTTGDFIFTRGLGITELFWDGPCDFLVGIAFVVWFLDVLVCIVCSCLKILACDNEFCGSVVGNGSWKIMAKKWEIW